MTILTIFRSRLKPGIDAEYQHHVDTTSALVETAEGFIGHKLFVADDGERLTVVEFETPEAQRKWSMTREHVEAKKASRVSFYAAYTIQICQVQRESRFPSRSAAKPEMPRIERAAAGQAGVAADEERYGSSARAVRPTTQAAGSAAVEP